MTIGANINRRGRKESDSLGCPMAHHFMRGCVVRVAFVITPNPPNQKKAKLLEMFLEDHIHPFV